MSLPPPDAFWTSTPREGIRDNSKPIMYSTSPDVCKTPIGSATPPIPYGIVAYPDDAAGNYSSTVRFTGQKVMLLRSNTTCCYGDEPGTAMGVKSGTVGDICEPLDHSATVRIEGSPVYRDGDKCHMNKRNTCGVVAWKADLATHGDKYPRYAQAATGTMTDAGPASGNTKSLPKISGKLGNLNIWKAIADGLTGGAVTQAQIENSILGELDYYANTPGKGLPLEDMDILADAAAEIRAGPLIAGDLEAAEAIKRQAWEAVFANARQEQKDKANEEAKASSAHNVRVSASGKEIEICFDKPPGADQQEFERQLKEQQDELNNMSPEQYQANRGRFLQQGRGAGDATARRNARNGHKAQRENELFRENLSKGMNPVAAKMQAKAQTSAEMAALDALHALDTVAGGDPTKIIRLGDSGINRAIGRQWKSRVQQLDEYAKGVKGKQEKMKVKLMEC